MRLSTRSRYGTRLMLKLALNYSKGPVFLKDIAQEEEISEKYLSHLVIPLRASGLIYSLRGAHGGYHLTKSPAQITIKDIVCTLEGNLSPVECVTNPSICSRVNDCLARDIWGTLYEKISETLDSVTLKDLLGSKELKQQRAKEKRSEEQLEKYDNLPI
ncbi:MAG: RrF2 family transcriptional regulator [Atribacterota bacterium]|nr:RrF2 family transcriptional regulator [Atribacterota bacterium]MDD4896107.1 RrF2 family transcriptional regulator [Atribacterota bacterium]MDD5637315.1 RrF2 family transcriptional regulator [Atribacterota bacterium]